MDDVAVADGKWPEPWKKQLVDAGIAEPEPYDQGLHSAGQWRSLLQPEVVANMREQMQHGPRHITYVFEASGPAGGREVPTLTPQPAAGERRAWTSVQVRC